MPAVAPSSKIGQALPEDMFAAPAPASQQDFRVNMPAQQNGVKPGYGQQQFLGQQQGLTGSPARSPLKGSQQGFGAFAGSTPSTEVRFRSISQG